MTFLRMTTLLWLIAGAAMADDIGKLDPNMAIPVIKEDGVVWYAGSSKPFRLSGFPWFEQDRVFRRLPIKAPHPFPESVETLAWHTAGGQVSFKTDSERVLIRVKLPRSRYMYHMAPTGHSGFDLYIGEPGNKKFYAVSRLNIKNNSYEAELFNNKNKAMREFTLNFPLYNGVDELLIGIAEGAAILPPSPFADNKKIVIYGGSTVQGACASRPGAYHMSIVGRKLNMEVVNLGFSGSGKLEPELARTICEIENPAVIIIEAERNATYKGVVANLEKFVLILKEKYPRTPVVIMSANKRQLEAFGINKEYREKNLAFMRELADKMKDQGVYLFDSTELLGEDFYECTVDGTHPTDLGFYRMAEGFTPFLREILDRNRIE